MATVEIESWMEWTDPDNPGFGPGQRQIRFRTKNIPPVFRTCATRTASGGYTVNLNSKGESYFGTHKDDVNAAIEEALLEAETALLAMASEDWCEDECAAVQGFGDAIVDDASATASLVIGAYETGDPKCDPTSIGGVSPGLTITAQAPGKPGVDLRPLIEAIHANASGIPSNSLGAFDKFKDDVLNELDLIVTPTSSSLINHPLQPDGYPDAGYIRVQINSGYVSVVFSCPSMVPSFDNPETVIVGVALDDYSGDFSLGSTLEASEYLDFPPQVRWGDDPETGMEFVSGAIPSAISLFNDNDPPPREINETIPLTNNPDAEVWIPEPTFNDSPTTRLFADDAITIAYSYRRELVDPGFRSKCQYNLHYRYRDPELPICAGVEYWDLVTLPETRYPPGKHPPCTIKTYANYQPPTV